MAEAPAKRGGDRAGIRIFARIMALYPPASAIAPVYGW